MRLLPNWSRFTTAPSALLFIAMGAFGAVFAWSSYNLISLAMSNTRFILEFGLLALREGGLLQLIEIVVYGYVSLAAYLGFKCCEHVLVHRWAEKN